MRLRERFADVARRRRLSRLTVECYWRWVEQYLRHARRVRGPGAGWVHPRELGTADVEGFLTHLARDRRCSASAQNQAMCALVFLYKQVLVDEVGEGHLGRFEAERGRRVGRVPTVLSVGEAGRVIAAPFSI